MTGVLRPLRKNDAMGESEGAKWKCWDATGMQTHGSREQGHFSLIQGCLFHPRLAWCLAQQKTQEINK